MDAFAGQLQILAALAGVIVSIAVLWRSVNSLRSDRRSVTEIRPWPSEAEEAGGPSQDSSSKPKEATKPLIPIDERGRALLDEYHAQGLSQSKISFWFSIIFASLGFLIIASALLRVNIGASMSNQAPTIISLISGTVIDAVSALFFVQSNKARQLMTEFFDRLRKDRKFEEALRLAGSVKDPSLQSRLQTLLALSFAELNPPDDMLRDTFNSLPALDNPASPTLDGLNSTHPEKQVATPTSPASAHDDPA
jgi:hypothetical protein